jgi:Do/DeqQ family serine protease
MKKILGSFLVALFGGIVALGTYIMFFDRDEKIYTVQEKPIIKLANNPTESPQQVDLTQAAEYSVKTVVHVKTLYDRNENQKQNPLYDFFFGNSGRGYQQQPVLGSGSGVILSEDGYIVTNNHVVKGSDRINVVLSDKRSYDAKLVGQDPFTDLALLKIDEEDLPAIDLGNSDDVRLGEWVLAVGNPFNLTSTVTAGIISAKARTLGVIGSRMSIEAFLQTDAAVNPGNSGGALVNSRGQLVGINTAIESRTGSYSGYSFAIPVNIVKKVVTDLKQYGEVQRAFLGVSINTVDAYLAEKVGLDKIEGVYIADVNEGGAADRAGIRSGDVILKMNGKHVNSSSQLQEQVSMYKPGDKVDVLIKRDNKKKQIELVLRNKLGDTGVIRTKGINILGADFVPITREEKYKLQISRGMKVKNLRSGKLRSEGVKEGFIIFKINNTPIRNVEDITTALQENQNGGVFISGIYPNGRVAYYAFSLNEEK